MDSLATVDTETILAGRSEWIGPDVLDVLSKHPLECIETEYPHHCRSAESPDGPERPAERHPIFYGCFDWHSAVHSHWCLVRQLRLFDDHPAESAIVSSLNDRITPANAEAEAQRLASDGSFEKPYGWAWFLRFVAELHRWDADLAAEWRTALDPLEEQLRELVRTEFLPRERPFRVGTHQNSAFALAWILDYARAVCDERLESTVIETSRRLFLDDADYPVEYEPLGWDFLSPGLTEADLMRRVLDGDEFVSWLDGFIPDVTRSAADGVLEPVAVEPNPDEGVALHFVGLNLSRAWCLADIAVAIGDHRYARPFEQSAEDHVARSLDAAFTDDYAGAHWLSSFVLYLFTRNEGDSSSQGNASM